MGIDNLEDQKNTSGSPGSEQSAEQAPAAEERRTGEPDSTEADSGNASRMDAAKAFFRAMYAGEDVPQQEQGGAPDNRRVQLLEQQLKEAEQRTAEAENAYKRLMADFDNFRRRMEREREEYTNIGIKKAADALIEGLDDLDRALLYLNPETPAEKIIESFKLVGNRVFSCLEKAGIKRMSTQGVEFDPRLHDPVMQVDTTEHPDNTVVQELRAGYFLGDKVLRAAMVSVASNPSMPAPSLQAAKEAEEAAKAEAAREAAAREEAARAQAAREAAALEAAALAAAKEAEAAAAAAAAKAAAAAAAAAKAKTLEVSPLPELEGSQSQANANAASPKVSSAEDQSAGKSGEQTKIEDGVYDLGDLDDV